MKEPVTEVPLFVCFKSGLAGLPAAGRAEAGEKGRTQLELARLGAPVPPGCIVTAAAAAHLAKNGGHFPEAVQAEFEASLAQVEKWQGRALGDRKKALFLSVRVSPPRHTAFSLPTVLNLGFNDDTVKALLAHETDPWQVWDGYRRFVLGFACHVLGVSAESLDELTNDLLQQEAAETVHDLTDKALEELTRAYLAQCEEVGAKFPADPRAQLLAALNGGVRAWNGSRALAHRRANNLEHVEAPAFVVQAMVWGTGAVKGGAGNFFTRVPASGEEKLYGKFLPVALGQDLTSGDRMPEPLAGIKTVGNRLYGQCESWGRKLEHHFHDAMEVKFTVEGGKLFLLAARSQPRTAMASLRIALDLVKAGISDERQALLGLDPVLIDRFLHPTLDKSSHPERLTRGLPASPGSAVGQVVFFAEHAEDLARQGIKTILVRHETAPEDIGGLNEAEGILTATGGLTSHAAVVARGMGKCCVVGATAVEINYHINEMIVEGHTVRRLDWISLDGNTGEIFLGKLPQIPPSLDGGLAQVLVWADRHRRMGVRANADTPEDARRALELGAEGIGLCRTEHMFFDMARIPIFRKMILAVDEVGRTAALAELQPLQRKDFLDIFRVMDGRPVTIRLLDPPLNEFLPRGIRSQTRMAKAMDIPLEVLQRRTEVLSEANPMLGHRGCRLAITYPEIYQMQVRAIVEAACIVKKEGVAVEPEIMVPLVSTARELEVIRDMIVELVERVMGELGEAFPIKIGTMIETPRAAVCAETIAAFADFFSFGTNDLTQMGYGFSRDDAGIFLPTYLEESILDFDPFVRIDEEGIGAMVRIAVEQGRRSNPALKIGICGEHGGDAASVKFFEKAGLDYVSCSPFRAPIARLAAAQATIEAEDEG